MADLTISTDMFQYDQIGTVLLVCLPKTFGFPKSHGKNAVKPDLSSLTLCESEPEAKFPKIKSV